MTIDAAKPKHRYVALDSLRGVCACMVVLLHIGGNGFIGNLPVVEGGWLFVDFFFVLSGFVIATSYGTRLSEGFQIRRFMWLRLCRIYPLHLFVLVIFLLFETAFAITAPGAAGRHAFQGVNSVDGLIASLFLGQIFVGPAATWNLPAWSIAAEMWTYLTFAFVFRYGLKWAMPICIAIAAAALVILFNLTDRYMNVFHEGAFLRCLFGFSMGVVAWRLAPWVNRMLFANRDLNTLLEFAVVAFVTWFVSTCGLSPWSLAAPFVFLVAVLIFSRQRGAVSSLLTTRPFERLGLLSFSIYMVHIFLLYRFVNVLSVVEKVTGMDVVHSTGLVNKVGGGLGLSDALTIGFVCFVVWISGLTYRYIELPGQRIGRRGTRRQAAMPQPAAP